MFGFSSKKALNEVFQGYTDYHCHILPGVDDGFRSLEDSLKVLSEYEEAGVKRVWLTPHIMEDVPNTTEHLREVFEALKANYRGSIELCLASENMMDALFEERLEADDLLPQEGKRLLVETSYFNPPLDLEGLLRRIMSKGYYPLLAHPERYAYMSDDDYDKLRQMGVLFQLNIASLLGMYGQTAKKKAEYLLKNNYYQLTGTDLHRLRIFSVIRDGKVKKSVLKYLMSLCNC